MKFFVDNKEVLELNETHQKIIQDVINPDIFVADMERRVNYIVSHKLENCYDSLIKRWLPTLRERFDSLPTNKDALAELVFAQNDYKPQYSIETPIKE